MNLLLHLVLLGVLFLSSCDKPVGVELPNPSKDAIQFDTVGCADFVHLMDKIGAQAGSELSTIEIRHGAELFEIKVAALSEIDPMMIVVKGEAILIGEERTPADMAALAEALGFFADGCKAAGCDHGVALFALEGADMNTDMAVIREMSGRRMRGQTSDQGNSFRALQITVHLPHEAGGGSGAVEGFFDPTGDFHG